MTTATDLRDPSTTDATSFRWRMVVDSLKRPYRVTLPMVVLVLLVPFYLYIAEETRNRAVRVPELTLDRVIPVQPAWVLVPRQDVIDPSFHGVISAPVRG